MSDQEHLFIPLYPRGRPTSTEVCALVDEVFILTKAVDTSRSLEPPMSGAELRTSADRPTDEVLLERFVTYLRRTGRRLTDPTVLVIPWRARVDHELRRTLMSLAVKLPFINTESTTPCVLFFEDPVAALDFEDYARRDGTVIGSLHRGGIWYTDYGNFFLLSWQPTARLKVLAARLLHNLLQPERAIPSSAPTNCQSTIPPPSSPPRTAPARTVRSPSVVPVSPLTQRPSVSNSRAPSGEKDPVPSGAGPDDPRSKRRL